MNMKYLTVLILLAAFSLFTVENFAEEFVFGEQFKALDNAATGEWWKRNPSPEELKNKNEKNPKPIVNLNVERDKVVAFALYTHDDEVLKLTGQLYPLMPDELLEARLEVKRDGEWLEIAKEPVQLPGWSAHFRIANWDATKDVAYRVRHGAKAMFEGLIRHDPIEKNEILVGNLSCNSSRTPGERPRILKNLKLQDVDVASIKFPGLLHHLELSPHQDEVLSIKIQADTSPPSGAVFDTTLVTRYVTLNLHYHDRSTLLAGKLNALLTRGHTKGRDIYDLMWYLSQPEWPEPNLEYLNNALQQFDTNMRVEDWRESLAKRLSSMDWGKALADVRVFLERQEDLEILTRENILKLLG